MTEKISYVNHIAWEMLLFFFKVQIFKVERERKTWMKAMKHSSQIGGSTFPVQIKFQNSPANALFGYKL